MTPFSSNWIAGRNCVCPTWPETQVFSSIDAPAARIVAEDEKRVKQGRPCCPSRRRLLLRIFAVGRWAINVYYVGHTRENSGTLLISLVSLIESAELLGRPPSKEKV
jgi:hypothetical protein